MHTIITVSRQLGSWGSYIATEVAGALKMRYVDREVLRRATEKAGFSDETLLAQLERDEQLPTLVENIVKHILHMPLVPAVASATIRESYAFDAQVQALMDTHTLDYADAIKRAGELRDRTITSAVYARLVQRIFQELANQGDMVFVGRGGQIILREDSNAIHLRVYAPIHLRNWCLQQRLGISEKQAEREIIQSDRQRAQYLQKFFGHAWDDPELYDLTINTGRISTDAATALIINLAQHRSRRLGLLPGL